MQVVDLVLRGALQIGTFVGQLACVRSFILDALLANNLRRMQGFIDAMETDCLLLNSV